MALSIKRAGDADYGRTAKLLICGDPGAGKTRMSASFPNPLLLNVEGGTMSLADMGTPYIDINNTDDLNAVLMALRQSPKVREQTIGVPVNSVIIDTIDALQKLLIDERKRHEKKDSLAIADWGWLGDQMRLIVRNYRGLPDLNVIFTCHVKTINDAETGQTFVQPALQGAMGDEIAAYMDIVGLLKASPSTVMRDGKAVKVLTRTFQTGADVRHPWLKDRSGRLPIDIDVALDSDDGPRLLNRVFGEGAPKPAAAPVKKVTELKPVAPRKQAAPVAAAPPSPKEPEPKIGPELEVVSPSEGQAPEVEETPTPVEVVETPQELNETAEEVPSESETVTDAPVPDITPVQEETPADMLCEQCGDPIETEDQRDLSNLRFRKRLDRKCFVAAKAAKAAS